MCLPGVGHDYQDHNEILCAYKTALGIEETQNALLGGLQTLADAAEKGDPRLGWNTVDVAGKIRPSLFEVAALGPDFEVAWEKDFKHEPAKPLGLIALIAGYLGDRSLVQGGEFVQVVSYSAYPYSRGSIHITGPEITDKSRFVNGYLTDANDFDLKAHVWQYKKQREIMRRTRMYRGEVAAHHPVFPLGSKAACQSLDILQSTDTTTIEDVVYTVEDDKAIEDFVRENLTTTWHALGTAKMAPREDMGVVDRSLNVYGVRGVKVVDLSIVPENVGANTNNTAMMIGEKGAVIIAEGLGLGRVYK
ncbi:related to alcohol oxidase [Rhynchosporium secalis]|uniref:Related to alcohol oxidase n=1 Tax=Rhynchosporium secalis TaxID=38038 RepID=A0A1E1MP75_RHYSE|nr:related to alcohol oxidase [Rhynchosporium secalis]